jgi:hypothetical protein
MPRGMVMVSLRLLGEELFGGAAEVIGAQCSREDYERGEIALIVEGNGVPEPVAETPRRDGLPLLVGIVTQHENMEAVPRRSFKFELGSRPLFYDRLLTR